MGMVPGRWICSPWVRMVTPAPWCKADSHSKQEMGSPKQQLTQRWGDNYREGGCGEPQLTPAKGKWIKGALRAGAAPLVRRVRAGCVELRVKKSCFPWPAGAGRPPCSVFVLSWGACHRNAAFVVCFFAAAFLLEPPQSTQLFSAKTHPIESGIHVLLTCCSQFAELQRCWVN